MGGFFVVFFFLTLCEFYSLSLLPHVSGIVLLSLTSRGRYLFFGDPSTDLLDYFFLFLLVVVSNGTVFACKKFIF